MSTPPVFYSFPFRVLIRELGRSIHFTLLSILIRGRSSCHFSSSGVDGSLQKIKWKIAAHQVSDFNVREILIVGIRRVVNRDGYHRQTPLYGPYKVPTLFLIGLIERQPFTARRCTRRLMMYPASLIARAKYMKDQKGEDRSKEGKLRMGPIDIHNAKAPITAEGGTSRLASPHNIRRKRHKGVRHLVRKTGYLMRRHYPLANLNRSGEFATGWVLLLLLRSLIGR